MRYPATAGSFYPASKDALSSLVERCFNHPLGPGPLPSVPGDARTIKAVVSPHAGISVSGPIAAHSFATVYRDGLPDTFVIVGPSHRSYGPPVASTLEDFIMPGGVVEIDRELVAALGGIVEDDPQTHMYEHSLEVQIPFIQRIAPDARIVPLAMNAQDMDTCLELARSLRRACEGRNVVIVASTDLTHYESDEVARAKDGLVIERILANDPYGVMETVKRKRVSMCGVGPVISTMLATEFSTAHLLKYSNSGEVLGGQVEVVGYVAISFE